MKSIPYSRQSIQEDDYNAIMKVLHSDFITQGPEVVNFENALIKKFKVNHALACSSGTAALHLAYASMGAGSTSLGIVPAVTFAATANSFHHLGSKVVFCDVDPTDGLIDLQSLEETLSKVDEDQLGQTNFVSPVSLAGKVAPLQACRELSSKYGFKVVEDASHSPGAWSAKEKSCDCKWTDAACMSFHPVKHICCGEGGAVLTNSESVFEKAKLLRNHGISRPFSEDHETPWQYQQVELGWNYRMTDMQAALGISQLSRLENSLSARKSKAKKYESAFSLPPFREYIELPRLQSGHSLHLYVIRFKIKGLRNQAYKFLKSRGILTQVHYIPLYRHPYFENSVGRMRLPGAEEYFESCLSIPLFPTLGKTQQEKVIDEIASFLLSHT